VAGEIDPTYLPFSEAQLKQCLAAAAKGPIKHSDESEDRLPKKLGIGYYTNSAARYAKYRENPEHYRSIAESKLTRQIEKDERFWTAATLMAFKYSQAAGRNWSRLLSRCFQSSRPPVGDFASWEDALGGSPTLLLEAPLPSPKTYTQWLREHHRGRQLIPYVFDAVPANIQAKLEGFTHADAILVNPETHFSVVFESKVLADISTETTFDCMRNQIARIIDVILEGPDPNEHLLDALSQRSADLTCFVLLTPGLFKVEGSPRLYGRILPDYQRDSHILAHDLPHRSREDWDAISKRIGWLTWEECNEVLPGACKWLNA
jgi:hypothetical protein